MNKHVAVKTPSGAHMLIMFSEDGDKDIIAQAGFISTLHRLRLAEYDHIDQAMREDLTVNKATVL